MLQSETPIGWQDYVAIIVRRRWFFTVPCVTIVVVSLLVGLVLPKVYRAETVLLVQDKQIINPLIQGLAVSTPIAERLRVLREELLSWTSLSRLVHELQLDTHAKAALEFERLIKRLQRTIDVRMRGRDLIAIAYEDRDPKRAQTLVNTITHIYMERNIESQSGEAETAISFLENEMMVYEKKLEDSERALREFKELYAMQMPVATQLNQQIIQLEVTLAQLLIENTEEHPTVVQTTRRIAELKQKRNDEIRRVLATAVAKGQDPVLYADLAKALSEPLSQQDRANPTLRAAKEAYTAWVNRLESPIPAPQRPLPQVQVVAAGEDQAGGAVEVIAAESPLISLGPREEQELARLTRDYQVYSKTYQRMQERLERAKTTQRLGASDEGTKFKVLEPARLPLKPVRPNLVNIFCLSLLLGLCVGVGVAFVAEYLDQSFQSAEDLQGALALPVIGSISTIVTEADLEARRRARRRWMVFQRQCELVKSHVLTPAWRRLDAALVRWGL